MAIYRNQPNLRQDSIREDRDLSANNKVATRFAREGKVCSSRKHVKDLPRSFENARTAALYLQTSMIKRTMYTAMHAIATMAMHTKTATRKGTPTTIIQIRETNSTNFQEARKARTRARRSGSDETVWTEAGTDLQKSTP